MAKEYKRYYGIKFPFTTNNESGYFVDLNRNPDDKVATEMLHVILTPKRSRIYMPEFGTNLIKYIFDPSDNVTWDLVKDEATKAVSTYVENVILNDIKLIRDEDNDNGIILRLSYTVKMGEYSEEKELGIKL